MTIKTKTVGDVLVVSLKGNFLGEPDISQLRARIYKLLEGGTKKMVISLNDVKLMNSSGLGTLIAILTSIRNRGGEVHFANVGANVASLFMVTKLVKVLKTYDTVDRAVAGFRTT